MSIKTLQIHGDDKRRLNSSYRYTVWDTCLEHHVNLAARRHRRHGAAGRDETVAAADADGGARAERDDELAKATQRRLRLGVRTADVDCVKGERQDRRTIYVGQVDAD